MSKTLGKILALAAFLVSPDMCAREEQIPSSSPQTLAHFLTLDEAIRMALAQHPALRGAREEIRAADALVEQAKSGYYPQISASGFAKQGLSGASGALGLRGLVTSPLFRDIGASAAAFQNLYDFGRTAHQVRASRWTAESLKHVFRAQQAAVILDVQRAYYNALEQQRLVKVAEDVLKERRLTVRQAAAFQRAQLGSKLDSTIAEVNAANASLELTRAQDGTRTAYAELNHAMAVEGESAYSLEEPQVVLAVPTALHTLLSEGQSQRPELSALDAQVRAGNEIVARMESNRRPKLMGLFSGGWVRFSKLTPGRLLLGAFGIDLPIFTAGRIENEIAEAKARAAQTQAAREQLAQDIRLEVQRAHLVSQAREALRLAQVR